MTDTYKSIEPFLNLDENQILALCIWGESRGESIAGKIAVLNIILNRSKSKYKYFRDKHLEKTYSLIHSIILKKYQFSCFLTNDPNYKHLIELAQAMKQGVTLGTILQEIHTICKVKEFLIDNTKGANHYFAKSISLPSWSKNMTYTLSIDNHVFYRY